MMKKMTMMTTTFCLLSKSSFFLSKFFFSFFFLHFLIFFGRNSPPVITVPDELDDDNVGETEKADESRESLSGLNAVNDNTEKDPLCEDSFTRRNSFKPLTEYSVVRRRTTGTQKKRSESNETVRDYEKKN